jgi:hypothetical protein
MKRVLAAALLLALNAASLSAQQTPTPTANTADKGQMLLTILFKHDQSKTLDEINEQLKRQKFYEKFPRKMSKSSPGTCHGHRSDRNAALSGGTPA